MQKTVWHLSYAGRLRRKRITLIPSYFLHLGTPTSERLQAGQAPRILTKDEQENMRIVCRVSSLLL